MGHLKTTKQTHRKRSLFSLIYICVSLVTILFHQSLFQVFNLIHRLSVISNLIIVLQIISSPLLVSKWSAVKMFSIQLLSSCEHYPIWTDFLYLFHSYVFPRVFGTLLQMPEPFNLKLDAIPL